MYRNTGVTVVGQLFPGDSAQTERFIRAVHLPVGWAAPAQDLPLRQDYRTQGLLNLRLLYCTMRAGRLEMPRWRPRLGPLVLLEPCAWLGSFVKEHALPGTDVSMVLFALSSLYGDCERLDSVDNCCPSCGALPGNPCTDPRDRPRSPHARRMEP